MLFSRQARRVGQVVADVNRHPNVCLHFVSLFAIGRLLASTRDL